MKKLESKWTYAVLLLPMILCVFYSKLCDVNAMMKESRLIFDPYGFGRVLHGHIGIVSVRLHGCFSCVKFSFYFNSSGGFL